MYCTYCMHMYKIRRLVYNDRSHLSLDNGSEKSPHLEQVKVSEAGSYATVQQHQSRPVGLLDQDVARVKISVDKVVNE